jgi:hypothetical protein
MKNLVQGNLYLYQNLNAGPPENHHYHHQNKVYFYALATAFSPSKNVHWIVKLDRI